MVGFPKPWLYVDVGQREVVSATGLNLALGDIAVRVPVIGTIERDGAPALPLVAAGILIAATLALPFLANPRRGAKAGLVLSSLASCLIAGFVGYAIYVHLPLSPEQMSLIEQVADTIRRQVVGARVGPGCFVTMGGLAVGMMLDWSTLRDTRAPSQK